MKKHLLNDRNSFNAFIEFHVEKAFTKSEIFSMKLDINHFHDQCQVYQEVIELYIKFIYLLVLMFYQASAHLRMRSKIHLCLQ